MAGLALVLLLLAATLSYPRVVHVQVQEAKLWSVRRT
jgi:hypothetical protein